MPDAKDEQAATAAAQAMAQAIAREAESEAHDFTDEDLLEALASTDIEQSQIRLPGTIQDAIRTRASMESAYPIGGKRIQVSKGELLAFLWDYFQRHYGPPTGEIARYVAQMRANWDARVEEAVRRGLIDGPRAARARASRENPTADE